MTLRFSGGSRRLSANGKMRAGGLRRHPRASSGIRIDSPHHLDLRRLPVNGRISVAANAGQSRVIPRDQALRRRRSVHPGCRRRPKAIRAIGLP